jgi:hypothetical protein
MNSLQDLRGKSRKDLQRSKYNNTLSTETPQINCVCVGHRTHIGVRYRHNTDTYD